MIVCTVCATNHLPKAVCLINSLRDTQQPHRSVLCLIERGRSAVSRIDLHPSVTVVLASELGIPNFDVFMFRHRLYEACGAIKAQLLLWAMQRFPDEERFIYLDSDTYAYSAFDEMEPVLSNAEVLLTPHHVDDEEFLDGIRDHMIRTLLCGIFNSGFVAVRRTCGSLRFLKWWNSKLQLLCYTDPANGLYNEQRWLDLAISFFDVTVFREPGYNVANWNVAKRVLTRANSPGLYLIAGKPLRFFHFSMVDTGRDLRYFRKYLDASNPVFELRDEYIRKVKAQDPLKLCRIPWTYSYFQSGEYILDETRFAYRDTPQLMRDCGEPFTQSNSVLLARAGRANRRTRRFVATALQYLSWGRPISI